MLEKYRPTVASLQLNDASYLRSRFSLSPQLQLHDALAAEGLDQATVVLALLHAGRHAAVRLFVEIRVFPPQASPQRNLPLPRPTPTPDQRALRPIASGNPLTIPTARARWDLLLRCRTVGSYAARVPRWLALRDVREWSRRGWLEVA